MAGSGAMRDLYIGRDHYSRRAQLSSLEVDEVINCTPGVKAGMAVGSENTYFGEEIGAYVVREATSAITEAQVLAACAAKLPFERQPKVVIFGDEFPVTATGKY